MNNTCAIYVTYNPDIVVLKNAVALSLDQVKTIYIIDNGSSCPFCEAFTDINSVEFLSLGTNMGIAAALNVGIKRARSDGFDFALLLDQDSVPPEGMIARYLAVFKTLGDDRQRVAALGPRYQNPQTGYSSKFVRFDWFRNTYLGTNKNPSVIPVDFLITSGSFYALNVFDDVGLFDGGLFIDHVDTEWCHRAKSRGYQCFGVWDVIMEHSLGESGLRFWLFRWRVQPIHKPFRLYFIIRNSLLMYRMPHVPFKFISGDVLRLLRLIAVYSLFVPNKGISLTYIFKGIIDGVRGVSGCPSIVPENKKMQE